MSPSLNIFLPRHLSWNLPGITPLVLARFVNRGGGSSATVSTPLGSRNAVIVTNVPPDDFSNPSLSVLYRAGRVTYWDGFCLKAASSSSGGPVSVWNAGT